MDIVVNGVTYNGVETVAMKDTSGRTVMFYPRMTITVTGEGLSGVCSLTFNGNEITTPGTYIVSAGDTIECYVYSRVSGQYAWVFLNGSLVLSKEGHSGGTYSYVVSKNASIALTVRKDSKSREWGIIRITEEE